MPTKRDKGGKPRVLLGRPFLKTARFKLIYYDEIFTFEVGNVIEIFHLPPPPKPRKKGLHKIHQDKGKKIKDKPLKEEKGRTCKEKKPMIKAKGANTCPLDEEQLKMEVTEPSIYASNLRTLNKSARWEITHHGNDSLTLPFI
ncbi:hypothetical protein PIB30_046062 [Stylosanthes scabra]|uniref:Uncharacterized protein n=1 Tax=Stylosanthes scabra TaxID=79078 RepID=A0ABU6SG82_9FABA|nr:hypothetical protein [Stylosanthes scabra]